MPAKAPADAIRSSSPGLPVKSFLASPHRQKIVDVDEHQPWPSLAHDREDLSRYSDHKSSRSWIVARKRSLGSQSAPSSAYATPQRSWLAFSRCCPQRPSFRAKSRNGSRSFAPLHHVGNVVTCPEGVKDLRQSGIHNGVFREAAWRRIRTVPRKPRAGFVSP
jgi:hypothetical protein